MANKIVKSNTKARDGITRTGISLPPSLLGDFDGVIARTGYANRSEAIRDAIRDFVSGHRQREKGWKGTCSVIAFTYDHEAKKINEELVEVQHSMGGNVILSSLHAHLPGDTCLEVILTRGTSEEVSKLADAIRSRRGVMRLELVNF